MRARQQTELNPSTNRNLRDGSLVDRLMQMEVGDEMSLQRYLHPDSKDVTPDGIVNVKRSLTSTVTRATGRVKLRDEVAEYAVETGVLVTSNNHLYIVAIITRNA